MRKQPNRVSDMLLYVKTNDAYQPNPKGAYLMIGNRIMVKTIDLICDFDQIKKQLDDIIKEML